MTQNNKKEEVKADWEEEFDKLLSHETHEYCTAHGEGQYCHLDDEPDNKDNVIPKIKSFISQTLEREREKIETDLLNKLATTTWGHYDVLGAVANFFSDARLREIDKE